MEQARARAAVFRLESAHKQRPSNSHAAPEQHASATQAAPKQHPSSANRHPVVSIAVACTKVYIQYGAINTAGGHKLSGHAPK
eukprot:3874722-Lingulodinium_polyedra.AAC.1